MPALRQRRWTIEEFDQLVDERAELGPRYELVEGELLVTPAPTGRHQRIVFALSRAYTIMSYATGWARCDWDPAKCD
jgi:Uma2 family endonuclease